MEMMAEAPSAAFLVDDAISISPCELFMAGNLLAALTKYITYREYCRGSRLLANAPGHCKAHGAEACGGEDVSVDVGGLKETYQ